MNREDVEREIVSIVRDGLLFGSQRPIPPDAPLGERLGLDSLALVGLVTAVEQRFGVELPDDIWASPRPLSVRDLSEIVVRAPSVGRPRPPAFFGRGRMERFHRALAEGGRLRRAAWLGLRLAERGKDFLFAHGRHFVLERRLDRGELPTVPAPPEIVLRPYLPEDEARLTGLWPAPAERHGRRSLARWLREGALALVAAEGNRIVALDLLSATGEDGVRIAPAREACYGWSLLEAPDVGGRQIGLALLAYSLRVARERGFRAELTYVEAENAPMLGAATQLLGFRVIGTARRLHLLGLT